MALVEQSIVQKLIASSTLTSLIGTSPVRIQWDRRPQASALPSITLSIISGVPEYSDEGSAGLATRRVQIDCWADDSTEAKTVANAVRLALRQPAMASGSYTFPGVFPENTIDFVEQEQGEKPIYRRMLEYVFWYYEEEQ